MDSKQHTILLVEDDSLLAATEIYWLKKAGYLVKHVSTGEDAVKTVNETVKGIDLVLMDINLGDRMDGTEAARIILKSHEIPLLFLSSHTEKEIVAKTEKITSYGYVVKDSKDVVLLASIKMAFKLFKANQELRNKEKAIEERENHLRAIIESAPFGAHSYELQSDGSLIFRGYNAEAVKILGFDQKNLLGKTIEEAFPPLAYTEIPALYKKVAADGKLYEDEQINYEDKRIADAFEIHAFQTSKNNMTVFFKNITDQKKSELAIRESEEKFRTLIEFAPDAFFQGDKDGNFITVNDKAIELTGYSREELLTMNMVNLFTKDEMSENPLRFDLLKLGVTIIRQRKIIRKSGELVNVEMHSNAMPDGTYQSFIRDISDRVFAEMNLRESERKYKDLFDKSDDAILIINNHKFVDCNKATLKMLGYSTKEDLLNTHPSEISPEFQPDGKSSLVKANEMMFITLEKGSHRFEWNHKKADGTISPVEVLLTAIDTDPKNSVIHTVWRDITERKEVLTKLAESESNYRMLIENQTDLVVKVDLDGKFQFVSPSYCRTFGKTQKELLGKAFIPLVHEDDREVTLKAMESLFSPPYTAIMEQRAMTKDGWRWISWVDTALLDKNGKVESIIGVGRDITERKFAEQELRRSEEKFRSLIAKMPDAVYKSTHEGKFLEVNPAMVQMLGYKDENELLEIDIKKDLYFDVAERESAALIEKYEEMAVFRLRKKDGSEIWVEDHGRHVLDRDGNVLYHEGIMRDVTERIHNELEIQKYSEQLKESNAAKDKLISIISHDLKNPFHSINSAVKLLIDEWSDISEEDKLKFLKAVLNTSEKSYNLLENLLLWSRQQMNKIEFLPERISLSEIVLDTLEIVKNAAALKDIAIKNNIKDETYVKADRMMISTVIRNLLTNAIKFTGEKGKIEIHAETHNDRIDLAISDNGIGISAEDIEKLFRIDLTYSTKGTNSEGGTGLGLIIAKDFVEKNNGSIWVESEINKGTKFLVSLERSIN